MAGTIAGYAETDEGEVIFSGIAPDAQLAIFKVLPDDGSGAPESTTMNALGLNSIKQEGGLSGRYPDRPPLTIFMHRQVLQKPSAVSGGGLRFRGMEPP